MKFSIQLDYFTPQYSLSRILRLFNYVFFIFLSINLHSQEWMEKDGLNKNNLFEIEDAFNEYWKDKERSQGDGYKPFMRWIEKTKYDIDVKGNILPHISYIKYENFIRQSGHNSTPIDHTWTPIGPSYPPKNGVGRINDIASHPSDPNRFYAASPSGGLWISDDACASWYSTTDKLAHIGITEIDIHPHDPNIIIAATGDDDGNDTRCIGLIKSIDKGLSWNIIASTESTCDTIFYPDGPQIICQSFFDQIHGVYWYPLNPNILIVAAKTGLYRTEDQGLTWQHQYLFFRDIKSHPTNPDIIYGHSNAANSCFVSQDIGENWIQVPLPNNSGISRGALVVSEQEPNTVYLAAASGSNYRLFKSIDQGNSYSMIPYTSFNFGSQSSYNWAATADPNNADKVYIGGVRLAHSEDGGQTLLNLLCAGSCIHVDFHYLGFHHGSLYAGNDGGVYRKTGSADWEELNNGLQITQYYRCSTAESDSVTVMAGSQDNGTHHYGYKWKKIYGGDGMDNAIDPNDPSRIYMSYQRGIFYKSTNSGITNYLMIGPSITGTNGVWVTPFSIDPNTPNILYAGYKKLWKSVDYGENWAPTSVQPVNLDSGLISYFDIAPSNSNVIYAYAGIMLYKSADGGTNWNQVSNPPNYVTAIEIDPTNENRLWVTGSQEVYESVDGGQSWNNIRWNIPTGISITTIVYDKNTNDHLYLGTKNGVWFKDASMTEWVQFNNLLPNVEIRELVITESYNKIRAATYGRGLWESYTVDHHACYDSLNIQHTIDEGIYHASKNITTDAIKTTNAESVFKAGTDIDLLPNFEVLAMTTFSAMIEECPEIAAVYNLPLQTAYYCETAIPLTNPIGSHQVDLTNSESYWFSLETEFIKYKVDILSCNEGVNTSLNLYRGTDCSLTSLEDITDYCSMMNANDNLAAGINDYYFSEYFANYIEWSADSPSTFEFEILITDSIGYYCELATPVSAGLNSGELLQDGGTNGGSSRWYNYTAPNTGTIDIISCDLGDRTNLLLWEGECMNKILIAENDNFCPDFGPITNSAALYGIPVIANTHYVIEWDSQDDGYYTDFQFIEHF